MKIIPRSIRLLGLVSWMTVPLTGCGGGGSGASAPTAPSATAPTVSATRVINVSGSLNFGQVTVGASQDATVTISNSGNSTLTVTGLNATSNFTLHSAASWTSGTIAAGASQTVTITFRPTSAGSFNGTLTVNADHTSGTNTIAFTASAAELSTFAGNWSGTYVVERCDGTGTMQDILCSAPSGSRPGGVFPIGTALPITMSLNQTGSSVTGVWALGTVTGTGTGIVTNGALTLQGTARSSTITAQISQWSTQVQGSSMTGTATYNMTLTGAPGVGVLVTRFSNVRK